MLNSGGLYFGSHDGLHFGLRKCTCPANAEACWPARTFPPRANMNATTDSLMRVVQCEHDRHAASILAIFNDAFRAWAAYKYSVEHSVYVETRFRRRGIGRRLLSELIAAAKARGYHLLIGGIDATNAESIRLHDRLGFVHCGTFRQVGFKFGRWLDLAFYQLTLPTPAAPNR